MPYRKVPRQPAIGSMVKRLRHRPFTAVTRVQFPLESILHPGGGIDTIKRGKAHWQTPLATVDASFKDTSTQCTEYVGQDEKQSCEVQILTRDFDWIVVKFHYV